MGFFSSAAFMGTLVAVVMFTIGIVIWNMSNKQSKVGKRVKRLQQDMTAQEKLDAEEDLEGFGELQTHQREKSDLAIALEQLLKLIGTNIPNEEKRLRMKLAQSGVSSPDAVAYYLFMKRFGLLIVAPIVAYLYFATQDAGAAVVFGGYIMMLVFLVAGMMGADLYLKNLREKRQKTLVLSFPDALDLMLVCVEAGLALDSALARVCRELEMAHPALTKELNLMRMELTLLNDRPRAMTNLAERTDLVAFRQLVSALLQSERFGTSLTETLRVLSEDFRYERLMRAENKAGRLPALMTLPLMLFLMPAFVMVLMAPAIIQVKAVWIN